MDAVVANANDTDTKSGVCVYVCAESNTFLTFGIDCKLYIFAVPYEARLVNTDILFWSVYCDALNDLFFFGFLTQKYECDSLSECCIVQ